MSRLFHHRLIDANSRKKRLSITDPKDPLPQGRWPTVVVLTTLCFLATTLCRSQEVNWEDIDVRSLHRREVFLKQFEDRLNPEMFDRVVPTDTAAEDAHTNLEEQIREAAEKLNDQWRRTYENAAEKYRLTLQQRVNTLALADKIDNNLTRYRSELESLSAKREGFLYSLSGLGKSYTLLVERPLTPQEMADSEEKLAALAEDCAKNSLAATKSATLILEEYGIRPGSHTEGATMVISPTDVLPQGSPPIWSFVSDAHGTVSFVYVQSYQISPQYRPPEFNSTPEEAPTGALQECLRQIKELKDVGQLPLSSEETQSRVERMLQKRDATNKNVTDKLRRRHTALTAQMKTASEKIQETSVSIRSDIRTLDVIMNSLLDQFDPDGPDIESLHIVQKNYLDSENLLGAGRTHDAPILNRTTWEQSLKSRAAARSLLVEKLAALVLQARNQHVAAIRQRSVVLWQSENVLVQGDPGTNAKQAILGMLDILKVRADRLRSYKVLQLGDGVRDQTLASIPGTEFYQPGVPQQVVFPKIRLHFRQDPEGEMTRTLSIFLALKFLYEQRPKDVTEPAKAALAESPEATIAKALGSSQIPLVCRQLRDALTSQDGPVRRAGSFLVLFAKDGPAQTWYLGAADERLPRGRLEGNLKEITCFEGWRLPSVDELRRLFDVLPDQEEPDLPEGFWTSDDDGLGIEWKVFFPGDGSDDYSGGAHMWSLAAVTDHFPE